MLGLALFICFFIFTNQVEAGTIIRSPAYLGLQRGLVGCWSFDGSYANVPDCSGNNNTGTLTNGPIRAAGKIGQALDFDGVNDYILINDAGSTVLDINGPVSICVWFKTNSVVAGDRALVSDNDGFKEYNFELTGDDLLFSWNGGTEESYTTTANIFQTGVWYHACGMRVSNSEVRFYVNGLNYAATWNGFDATPGNSGATNIGRFGNADSDYFNGLIDDVRIYNRALSATEIARLYRIGLGSTANRTSTSLDKGLVGHWTFDGADIGSSGIIAKDRSGNNNNGTITGAAPASGRVGQALSFDSSTDTVLVGDSVSLDITGQLTMSAWVKPRSIPTASNYYTILAKAKVSEDENAYSLYIKGNDLAFYYCNGADSTCGGAPHEIKTDDSPGLVADRWYHLAITYNDSANDVVLYIDGIAGTEIVTLGSPETSSVVTSTNNINIGSNDAQSELFDGLIDDVRIYNRALSASEINRLYQQTQSKFNASKTDSLTKGLVGYWTFDGADIGSSGTIAKDRSGNNNNGTITGATKAQGKIGQGLQFDGVNDVVNAGSGTTLANLGPMSLSAWIYPRTKGECGGNECGTIVDKTGNATNGWKLAIGDNSGSDRRLRFTADTSGAQVIRASADGSITFNTWQHVVMTWDGGTTASNVRFYINGVEPSYTNTADGGTPRDNDSTNPFLIGALGVAGPVAFDGLIDDVRIYNRALSASEIMKLYNMGR